MKIKTANLQGAALDWALAKCEGRTWEAAESFTAYHDEGEMRYSTDWSQGGPIIEREGITLRVNASLPGYWVAFIDFGGSNTNVKARQSAPAPLVAAMRCFVASRMGDEIEIPDELLQDEATRDMEPQDEDESSRPTGG